MRTIYGQRWYKPMEIAKQGLIQSSKGDEGTLWSHYYYIIRLINTGRLEAKNYSKGARPYYLVPQSEIERYHGTLNKVKPKP